MRYIKTMNWVLEHIDDPHIVIADCRFDLGQPDAGKAAYEVGHLPGARYFDLERELSSPIGEHGGRHPLPDLGAFALQLGEAGIGEESIVVAYDDQGGAMASRFWWLLQFLGHHNTFVMDQGFSAWKAAGYPVTGDIPVRKGQSFAPQVRTEMLASMEEVRQRLEQKGARLVDSREQPRYLGVTEPIDPVAGHIPGAVNHFWKESLHPDGRWKSPAEQLERFRSFGTADEIIVYCGSGVTACPNVLALLEAGYEKVKLYAGSWSDWISYKENPFTIGEE